MITGHEAVRAELEKELPPVTLLLGPPSIGKRTLALHLAAHHGMHLFPVHRLDAAQARELVVIVPRLYEAPGCFFVPLDGSTPTAQNILLKVLEEPPDHARFILTASSPPLPTVASRARVFRLGLLSAGQVAEILEACCGISARAAAEAASRSRGQVSLALHAASASEESRTRSVVSAALRAARDGGAPLELALRAWTPEHAAVLRGWAEEAAAGRWNLYSESFAPGATALQARRVLACLARSHSSRSTAAAALAAAFTEEK